MPPAPTNDGRSLGHSLKSHHPMMISIGGAIGTGFFTVPDAMISSTGPGGALLAYGLIGFMVWLVIQSLGEMITFLPVSGFFGECGHRFISPSFGFVMGWSYWFNQAITVAAGLVITTLVVKYWFPHVLSTLWPGLFLLILSDINTLSTKAYGESKFWFATIKVLAVIVFLVLGLAIILGIIKEAPGAQSWTAGEAPLVGGAEGVFLVILVAGYSFQNTELINVIAGEAEDPGYAIPRAIRMTFWRTPLFYIGTIVVIDFLIPYTDLSLLGFSEANISVNPFALIFDKAGALATASLIDAVILTSVLSASTSDLYVLTCMLFAFAERDHTPCFLEELPKYQVPVNAPLTTTLVDFAGPIISPIGDNRAYEFLLTVPTLTGFITWMGTSQSYYGLRKAFAIQNISLDSSPYHARLFPAGAVVTLVACVLIIIGQPYGSLRDGVPLGRFLLPFIGTPFFLALWAGHKLATKGPAVDPATADLGHK